MYVLNLTQHASTPEQFAAGTADVVDEQRKELLQLLTFETLPSGGEMQRRAEAIAEMAKGMQAAMIGGAPYLMGPLEAALKAVGVKPLYAFSVRESVETTLPDGKVIKTAVFRHLGFVEA